MKQPRRIKREWECLDCGHCTTQPLAVNVYPDPPSTFDVQQPIDPQEPINYRVVKGCPACGKTRLRPFADPDPFTPIIAQRQV